jgi:hypothetical protein
MEGFRPKTNFSGLYIVCVWGVLSLTKVAIGNIVSQVVLVFADEVSQIFCAYSMRSFNASIGLGSKWSVVDLRYFQKFT